MKYKFNIKTDETHKLFSFLNGGFSSTYWVTKIDHFQDFTMIWIDTYTDIENIKTQLIEWSEFEGEDVEGWEIVELNGNMHTIVKNMLS